MLEFHRKEQFDIVKGGIKKPLLVIGWKTPDHYARLFCLWAGGVWLRLWGNVRLCWVWARDAQLRIGADDAGQGVASHTEDSDESNSNREAGA